ncbi:MAG: hypothetical protein ACXAC2_25865 [Candidatus Kariarchaeaceae archaeon]|jgi:hypothetical protein
MVKEYSDMMLPPFAKYLDKYTKKWEISDMGGSLMIPKYNHYFNSILFRSRKLSFSTDKTWEFIASVPVVDKKDTSDLINKSFQLLKGAECEIKREGLFKKNFKFISNPMLEYLKEEIPELKIDTSLIESFEQDTDLRRLLSIIKPDKLSIKLFSQPIMTKDLEEYREEFKAIFYNPIDGIIWNIIIERYLDDIFTKSSYTN